MLAIISNEYYSLCSLTGLCFKDERSGVQIILIIVLFFKVFRFNCNCLLLSGDIPDLMIEVSEGNYLGKTFLLAISISL